MKVTLSFQQIEEDDVTNAAYGSDGSFFASNTVSINMIYFDQT